METLFDTNPTKVKKGKAVEIDTKLSRLPLPKKYIHGCIKETFDEIGKLKKLQTQVSDSGLGTIICSDDKEAEKVLMEFDLLYNKKLNKYIEQQQDDPRKYYKTTISFISLIQNGTIQLTWERGEN